MVGMEQGRGCGIMRLRSFGLFQKVKKERKIVMGPEEHGENKKLCSIFQFPTNERLIAHQNNRRSQRGRKRETESKERQNLT